MQNHKKRPTFLHLLKIRQPIPAVASILHRISGLLMVLTVPALLYVFTLSLSGAEGYAAVGAIFASAGTKIIAALLIWALAHHLFAGVRYLLIDVDLGVQRRAARASAWLVIAAGIVVALVFLGSLL